MEENEMLAVRDTLLRSALNRVNNAIAELNQMKAELENNQAPLFGWQYIIDEVVQMRELVKASSEIGQEEKEGQ